jgi:hypothetical protein
MTFFLDDYTDEEDVEQVDPDDFCPACDHDWVCCLCDCEGVEAFCLLDGGSTYWLYGKLKVRYPELFVLNGYYEPIFEKEEC